MAMSSTYHVTRDSGPGTSGAAAERGGCPIDHAALMQRRTGPAEEPGAAIERGADGVWRVRGFDEARAILRGADTKQAGFGAQWLDRVGGRMRPPILYLEGKLHHEQRRQTARFFTPKAVSENYRALMERFADGLIADFRRARRADLSALTLRLAVRVAGEVIGLTEGRLPGMARRLDAFFIGDVASFGWRPDRLWRFLRAQSRLAAFFLLDVMPAIRARRRTPREDVISHLLAQGYGDTEILTECVTFAAAGMVTTREFISAAAWHLLERPELRARFVAGDEDERRAILEETLRLEPVVERLYRRATADLQIESGGAVVTIPKGDLIDLRIVAVNADETVVGERPYALCPGRELLAERVSAPVMGFGDGHHRCPGAYIAMQETDIFLRRLLALDGLRVARWPTLGWNAVAAGYELRDFRLTLD